MFISILRFLANLFGVILTAASFLVTVVAGSVAAVMTCTYFTEPHLSRHDFALWREAAVCVPVGALLTWGSFRLANYGRPVRRGKRPLTSDPAKRKREERWVSGLGLLVALAAVGGLAWTYTPGVPTIRAMLAAGWTVGFFLLLHAHILWHELGHLVAGKLVGVQPLSLRVGSGPLVWQRVTPRGFWAEWRLWPWWGCVQAVDRQARPVAWRHFVAVAGGPLVDVLCLAFLFHVLGRSGVLGVLVPGKRLASGGGQLFGLLPLWLLVAPTLTSLVPTSATHDGHVFFSDGWWLCRAFFLPKALFEERAYVVPCLHMRRLHESGYITQARAEKEFVLTRFPRRRANLTLWESRCHHQNNEPASAEACFQQALDESTDMDALSRARAFAEHAAGLAQLGRADTARACCDATLARIPTAESVAMLDAFACIPFYHPGTAALLPDAERWCAEAMKTAPDEITLHGTHGALLFERGRTEEAVTVLREVLANTHSDTDRGIASFYLAMAAGQRGQRREMMSFRTQARRWCRVPTLLRRLHTELHPG